MDYAIDHLCSYTLLFTLGKRSITLTCLYWSRLKHYGLNDKV